MANDHVKMFTDEYGPIALQVSRQTGIAPSVLLAQWGMETDYGRKVPGHFNFGNIKDMSGAGTTATDNKTKSKDKYVNFESPEAFGDYYAHMMRRLYPNALNTGTDIAKYAEGLRTGVKGSYAEDENYENAIRGAHSATSAVYTDPEKIDVVRPPTQAEQIRQEREERGDTDGTSGEPPKTKEVIDPLKAAVAGALTSGPGQAPFRPEYAAAPPDLTNLEQNYRDAQRRVQIAESRLVERANNPNPIFGGADINDLEQEFRMAQAQFQTAERELQARMAASKAKVAPTPTPAAPSAPSAPVAAPTIITDPNMPSADQHTRAIQGTTVDDVTGRARQTTYNERTSQIARNAANQQQTLQVLGQQGIVDPKKAMALTEGISGSTPSGVMVNPDLAGERQQQAELEQRMAEDRAAQERLAQQEEMNRLKQERALAASRQSEAQRRLNEANRARTSGVSRAQTALDAAQERELLAQGKLQDAQRLAKNTPGSVGRALQNTGVATAKTSPVSPIGRTAIGALGGFQAATGANELANIPVADLIARWKAGDRSPEIVQALMQAGVSTAQIGTGAAAMLPAMGPKTAKIKGAGTIGTLGLGAYNAYKALTEPEPQQ